MKENPNYYAVIPAPVLFSKKLSANAKILYAEISALCNKKGFCWASNEYFAKHHDVAARSVQNWLSELKNEGFVEINYVHNAPEAAPDLKDASPPHETPVPGTAEEETADRRI